MVCKHAAWEQKEPLWNQEGPLSLGVRAAPGKSGLHARGEGDRVMALESREGTRASRCARAAELQLCAQARERRAPAERLESHDAVPLATRMET